MRPLRVQNNWPWSRSWREFLLLRSLRARRGDNGGPRQGLARSVERRLTTHGPRIEPTRRIKRNALLPGGSRKFRPRLQFRWASAISRDEWGVYRQAIEAVRKAGVRFLLGGGFALAGFTGRWRDTKDIDFYIAPQDRDRAVAALRRAGFADYYDRKPYDRKWIYRSIKSGVIVDIIWSMANQRAQVDDAWFERAGYLTIRGEKLGVVPMEEFVWCKLYILQRDHCDWTDILNLFCARGQYLDWNHLIARLEDDTALLKAVLLVYAWLCPKQAMKLPESLWGSLNLPTSSGMREPGHNRIRLLDSRAWFAALQPRDKKLEV
jgi:hypothetical protein